MAADDVSKTACYVPVSAELLADAEGVRGFIDEAVDRWLHPWNYPDHTPFPTFVLFPRLARLVSWLRAHRGHDAEAEAESW